MLRHGIVEIYSSLFGNLGSVSTSYVGSESLHEMAMKWIHSHHDIGYNEVKFSEMKLSENGDFLVFYGTFKSNSPFQSDIDYEYVRAFIIVERSPLLDRYILRGGLRVILTESLFEIHQPLSILSSRRTHVFWNLTVYYDFQSEHVFSVRVLHPNNARSFFYMPMHLSVYGNLLVYLIIPRVVPKVKHKLLEKELMQEFKSAYSG